MLGSTRFRRLATVGVAAALAVIAAGCTQATTTIPQGQDFGRVVCPIKAGQSSAATYWHPGPGTERPRFQILKSDSPVALTVVPYEYTGAGAGPVFAPKLEDLWDGTKSTGPKEVGWGPTNFSYLLLVSFWGTAPQETHTTWELTALDANGNDVGFTCASRLRYE